MGALVALAVVAATLGWRGLAGGAPTTDWPVWGGNALQDHLAPLPTLTPAAAAHLQPAFTMQLPRQGQTQEGYPVEVGGRLYVSTAGAGVVALDAVTGAPLWTRSPRGSGPNRGVAVAGGRLYVLDVHNRLVAVNAADGSPVFDASTVEGIADPTGYFESTAPIVADGLVLVGVSGGDLGARGFVEALSAADGHLVWRFFTVPPPGQGWVPATGSHGGGAVWTPVAVDVQAGAVYAAVGNPSPDFYGAGRPGANPYTDGVVALDLRSGKLLWYGPEVHHDLWDYDAASPPLLFPLAGGGRGVGEGGKDGQWYEWDAATGKPLTPPLPFAKQDHTPPTPQGTLEWPGTWGGANYGSSAYDPATGLAYVAGIDKPQIVKGDATGHHAGAADFGTGMADDPGVPGTGSVTAIDVATGKSRWRVPLPRPALGGVTVTSGGLVLLGTVDGTMYGLDAATGATVWQQGVGSNVGTAPIAYSMGGRVYVAVALGGGGMGGAVRRDEVKAWVVGG